MLAPSMEPEEFGPSFRALRHSNGPAIAVKMVGANIGSTGDGAPLQGAKNLRTSALSCLVLQNLDAYTLRSAFRADCI